MPALDTRRKLTPVSFTAVTLEDEFWALRQRLNREASLPHMHRMLTDTGRIAAFDLNFERAAPAPIVEIFGDSDVAKWVEAASAALATQPDPALAAQLENVVERILAAQQPDGYLNTHFIRAQPDMRWKNLRDWHELYCAGHLIEAAIAHRQATGNPKLLNALCRYADLITTTFGRAAQQRERTAKRFSSASSACARAAGQMRGYCGHPEIELALIRLYHATGHRRYLDQAHYFVEERGQSPHYYDAEAWMRGDDPAKFWAGSYEYMQAHAPIREQTRVVGHAVRAMYLYAAVADLAHELNDATLLQTCEQLWENVTSRRLYLTGGIGPSASNEGFTTDYDLPDETAYAETCAAIALMMWNRRLLQFAGEGKYADLIERVLYNGFLSGVSLDGARFFYENPLASAGHHHRERWFNCPCCPPNVGRVLATLGDYFYSTSAADVWVHLYAQSIAQLRIVDQTVRLRQVTRYPWEGEVQIELGLDAPLTFALHLRIPEWCDRWELRLNESRLTDVQPLHGYIALNRAWQPGDRVTLTLDMPVCSVWANPAVRQLQGRLALQRGPLVYCLEGADHGGIALDRLSLDPAAVSSFVAEHRPDLLNGVTVLRGRGAVIEAHGWEGRLYRRDKRPVQQPIEITAVPYYAWDNREPGEMRVWLRAAQ